MDSLGDLGPPVKGFGEEGGVSTEVGWNMLLCSLPGMPGLLEGVSGLTEGMPGLLEGVPGLTEGVPGLTEGVPGLTEGVPALRPR